MQKYQWIRDLLAVPTFALSHLLHIEVAFFFQSAHRHGDKATPKAKTNINYASNTEQFQQKTYDCLLQNWEEALCLSEDIRKGYYRTQIKIKLEKISLCNKNIHAELDSAVLSF